LVFRQLSDREVGRNVMHALKDYAGDKGIGRYSFQAPDVEVLRGEKLDFVERMKAQEYALAQHLANGITPNGVQIKRARRILDNFI